MTRNRLAGILLFVLFLGAFGLRWGPGIAAADGPDPADPNAANTFLAAGFTYQGRLVTGGAPFTGSCDFKFSLFNAAGGGQQVGATQAVNGVSVSGGLFTVILNSAGQFGLAAFDGGARWLRIDIKCGADPAFTTLAPRQPLTPAPYALSLPGLAIEQNGTSPNIVGGHISNTVTSGVVGATISGGGVWFDGQPDNTNLVTDDYATVGGGLRNVAGDVGGSLNNAAFAFVGGGTENWAGGEGAVVAGGDHNAARGIDAVVGGGNLNHAAGRFAAIPGGDLNVADATNSFAAGHRAKVYTEGTFVWADSTDMDFLAGGSNQFLIRASGGVGISTSHPENQLHVYQNIGATANPANHVVQFENPAASSPDILALRDSGVMTPATDANFITFFGSNATSLGAIQGNGAGGVVMAGPGNDFAEYLPKESAAELLMAGDIVGVHAGHLSRVTAGAAQVLVISTSPIVAGNAPGADAERDTLALAAFVGQAQVRVLGAVDAGSFVIPSGNNDGLGLAIAPENLTAEQAAQIAGQALESVSGDGLHTVRIAVGLPRDGVWANLLSRQNAGLQARVDALEKRAGTPATGFAGRLPWLLLAGVLLFGLGLFIGRRRAA